MNARACGLAAAEQTFKAGLAEQPRADAADSVVGRRSDRHGPGEAVNAAVKAHAVNAGKPVFYDGGVNPG